MEHEAALSSIRKGLHRSGVVARLAMRGMKDRGRDE